MKFTLSAHVRLTGFPPEVEALGISHAVFTLQLPVELFENSRPDGSMTAYAGATEVPAAAETETQAPAKRGRKAKAKAEAEPVVESPVAAGPVNSGYPMPLPTMTHVAPAPQMVGGVRTFLPQSTPGELTHLNGGMQLNQAAGVPSGSPVPVAPAGGFPGLPPQAVTPWATPVNQPPQMTQQELQTKMLHAFQVNATGFSQAMAAAGLNPAAVTAADAPRVMAALAPIIGS